MTDDETIDLGYVHVLTEIGGPCVASCPHPDHETNSGKPQVWGDGCECGVTPESMWTTYYGAVEPGSQIEYNPECPKHGWEAHEHTDDACCMEHQHHVMPHRRCILR